MTRMPIVTARNFVPHVILLAAVVFILLAAPARAGEQPAQAELSKRLAPLVNEQTFAVAEIRLDKLDVGRLMQLAGKLGILPAGDAATTELAGKLALTALTGLGARDVCVIASLDGFPFDLVCVAIPVISEEDGRKIAAALKLALKLQDSSARAAGGEWLVQPGKDFVLIAPQNTLKRMRTLQPAMPPHLEKALTTFSAADVRLAVVLPDTLRRSLNELLPQLPRELGGGKTGPLLDGFYRLSIGITLAPKLSAEALLQTSDARIATAIRTLLVDLMGNTVKEIARDTPDPKLSAHLARIVNLLTPRADNDKLAWKWTEDELIQALEPLAGHFQARSRSTQSANNLKQIGLAMHNYHAVNKHFPTGIRDKQGKLLLSWRVQVLPYIDELKLYKQFKLDEPWNGEHNSKLVQQMPAALRSPDSKADADKTTYLGPSGKGLFFDNGVPERKISDIVDGTSNTIMVLEADDDRAVTWTKPDDLNVDPRQPLKGLEGKAAGNFLALFADGSVRFLSRTMAPADFYKLLTIAGREVVPNVH